VAPCGDYCEAPDIKTIFTIGHDDSFLFSTGCRRNIQKENPMQNSRVWEKVKGHGRHFIATPLSIFLIPS
jgi:hypothetical protein